MNRRIEKVLLAILSMFIVAAHGTMALSAVWFHAHPEQAGHHHGDVYHTHVQPLKAAERADSTPEHATKSQNLHLWAMITSPMTATYPAPKDVRKIVLHFDRPIDNSVHSSQNILRLETPFDSSNPQSLETYAHFSTNLPPPVA